ncbi:MAG: adenosylmethionine--8-amino-7-oxononanoate transaminase [Gammaproteobacteria bacterium]|nr:adenosylmethionine--8-amino-7-oxononanoate transaminase [Gammaproteobacteria bacterium]
MRNSNLSDRDLSVLWHPCTQMKDHENLPLIPIKKGKGVWLEDYEGRQYIDAISSWWVNLFGHSNTYINEAIKQQLDRLEHTLFAGFTHEPAITLAERLVNLSPKGLNKCFFADNGSSAVEVALKMSFHYWLNKNAENNSKIKTKFVSLSNSYHGETLGALAVGDVALYKATYGPLLMECITVPSPDCYHRENGVTCEEHSRNMFDHMDKTLSDNADDICAVIVEPLVQCAGNMRMYHSVYLELLRKACDKYEILLIADEVAVGFGRTGKMFACEHSNISPDIMCLSKGLTGGYLALSAVLTTDDIYQAFYDDYLNGTAFLHSHSYTGNPLACAAANATLDIFRRDNTIEKNVELVNALKAETEKFEDHPHISEVRRSGMIVALEMVKDKNNKLAFPWEERRGIEVYKYALSQGVLLRPLGDVIYFMPPYIVTPDQIKKITNVAFQGITNATI